MTATETETERYLVSVYDMDRKRQVARNEFPVGQFQEIGYWLDDGGLIHPRYQVTITVGSPSKAEPIGTYGQSRQEALARQLPPRGRIHKLDDQGRPVDAYTGEELEL